MFRKLTRKLDPPRSDNAFHLANGIQGLGGLNACKDFTQTVRFVVFIEGKIKGYLMETGEVFPDDDAVRVLSQALDEDTSYWRSQSTPVHVSRSCRLACARALA